MALKYPYSVTIKGTPREVSFIYAPNKAAARAAWERERKILHPTLHAPVTITRVKGMPGVPANLGAKRKNPMQDLTPNSKAFGDHAVKVYGSELTAFRRSGGHIEKLARKYYASPAAAKAAYKRLTSERKIEAWAARHGSKRKNPVKKTRRNSSPKASDLRADYTWYGGQVFGKAGYAASLYTKAGKHVYDGPIESSKTAAKKAAIVEARREGLLPVNKTAKTKIMRKRKKNPVKSSTFSNFGNLQKQMLNFMIRNGPSKIYSIDRSAQTRRTAKTLQKRGIIKITNRGVESWQIRFTEAGKAWAKRRKKV